MSRNRKLLAVAAGVGAAVGGAVVAILLATGSSSATSCASSAQALLASRIVGARASYAKDNPLESQKVFAYLNGGTRPDTTGFTHMGLHLVYSEDDCRSLAPPTTSSTTTTTQPTTTTTTTTTSTTTTTTPPPVSYPASYFTGPLGANNFVPSKQGAFLIDFYGGIGVTHDQVKAGVAQREADMGRKFDGLMTLISEGSGCLNSQDLADNMLKWEHDSGHIPLVSWDPTRDYNAINAGTWDACFKQAADYFRAEGFNLMLRMFWEFDASAGASCGTTFIAAWQRVVGIFRAEGATNVGFWWNPTDGSNRNCVNISYPGDAYVDWVGAEVYNFCFVNEAGCYTAPRLQGWAEFAQIVDYPPFPKDPSCTSNCDMWISQYDHWSPHKPFVPGEVGTVYDPNAVSTKKGDWYRHISPTVRNMPLLAGLSFYDADVTAVEGPRNNFRVDYPLSNPDVYAGFKQLAADPWFNAK